MNGEEKAIKWLNVVSLNMLVGARRSAGLGSAGVSSLAQPSLGFIEDGPESGKCLADVMLMSQVTVVRLVEGMDRQLSLK